MEVSVDALPRPLNPADSNLSINTPLMEIIIDSSDKIVDVVHPIFGNCYTQICLKIKNDKKFRINCEYAHAITIVFFTAIAAIGAFLVTSEHHRISFSLIGVGVSCFLLESSIFAKYWIDVSTRLDKNMNLIKASDLFTEFYKELKSFRMKPDEKNVKFLFETFDNFNLFVQEKQLFDFFEKNPLFSLTGNFFLMDAVFQILEKKQAESKVVDGWKELVINDDNLALSDTWNRLGIIKPDDEFYSVFVQYRRNFESINFEKKMVEIFKRVIEDTDNR